MSQASPHSASVESSSARASAESCQANPACLRPARKFASARSKHVAPVTAATCLLRAETNFLAGRRQAGFAWHDSALARADDDSTEALWGEAWLIASPDEVTRHALTPRGYR